MTPIEIKSYFDSNPPPETFDFKPWAKITDCEKFLQSTYNTLASYNGNYEDCPAFWRLKEFQIEMARLARSMPSGEGQESYLSQEEGESL